MDTFDAVMFKWEGPGGWTFVAVPSELAPPPSEPWGRAPVRAEVEGVGWDTSVWHDRRHGPLLPVPARVRRGKKAGDSVRVAIRVRLGG